MTQTLLKLRPATPATYRTVQIWAVWRDDFDQRVRVEVSDWEPTLAREEAMEKGAKLLGGKPGECEARYVVTRTTRVRQGQAGFMGVQ